MVRRKREEYQGYVNQYFDNRENSNKDNKDTFRWVESVLYNGSLLEKFYLNYFATKCNDYFLREGFNKKIKKT